MSAELLCAGTGGLGPDTAYHDRRFAGCVLVSDNESWVGAGRGGSTAVVIEWQAFVANQQRLGGRATSPKLICIDLQPYTTTQAPEGNARRPGPIPASGCSLAAQTLLVPNQNHRKRTSSVKLVRTSISGKSGSDCKSSHSIASFAADFTALHRLVVERW